MAEYTEILRGLREDSDLTQAQVAAVLGTTQQVYARYEKGANELPVRHLRLLRRQRRLCFGATGGAGTSPLKKFVVPHKNISKFYKNKRKSP